MIYIDSPDWIKNTKKQQYILSVKRDNEYFQYAVTVALNYEEVENDSQRIRKIKPFINKYNWEE